MLLCLVKGMQECETELWELFFYDISLFTV